MGHKIAERAEGREWPGTLLTALRALVVSLDMKTAMLINCEAVHLSKFGSRPHPTCRKLESNFDT